MRQLLIVVILSILLFGSCATTRIGNSFASYQIINKLETINCKGRFIYYLVPITMSKLSKENFGSIDYVILDCDSFYIGDGIFTLDNVNFSLH